MIIKFTVPLDPVPQPRPRIARGRTYEEPRATSFKAAVAAVAAATLKGAKPMTGAVTCTLKFYRKFAATSRRFGDVDNLAKSALDGITGTAFVDDSQIVDCRIMKAQDRENPRVEIEIAAVTTAVPAMKPARNFSSQ